MCVHYVKRSRKNFGKFYLWVRPLTVRILLRDRAVHCTREGKWAKKCKKLTKIPDSIKVFAKWPKFQKVGKNFLLRKYMFPDFWLFWFSFEMSISSQKFLQRAQKVAKMAKIHKKTDDGKQRRFQKVAWIQSYHLHFQWKLKLWAGKFAWGVKVKHCWVLSTNKMFCIYVSSKLSRP